MNELAFLNKILPLWGVCAFPEDLPLFDWARRHPLPVNPRSVVVAAFPYLLPEECYAGRNIARYAVGADYHAVCGARLEQACGLLRERYPNEEFARYCDHSPLPEVALAQRAGLGMQGRHNLLITEEYGTWVVLGEIVTTALLPSENNCPLPTVDCQLCAAPCSKACPSGALSGTGFDKTKCLSYLSQRKGELSEETARQLRRARTAWGCDLCQEACPRNRGARVNPLPEFYAGAVARLTADAPLEGRAYAWRGAAALKRNIENLNEK